MVSSDLQAIYIMWLRQVKRFVRAKSRLLANILQPFFFLIILGFGFSSAKFPGIPQDISYIDFLAPGIVTMAVIFSSLFAGVSVIWDRQFGFLQEVLVAPVRRISIVIGRTFGGSTTAIVQGLIILGIAKLLGIRASLFGVLQALAFMVLIAFSAVGFGLLVASKMEDIHGFQLIMSLLIMPLIFLSSAFFPIEGLPSWLKYVVFLNPITYGVDGIRGSLLGLSYFPIMMDFLVVLGICVLMMYLGAYSFSKFEI